MTKEFLDIHELSEYLGIKKSTLYSKVESGEIPHFKVGRLIRFRKSEVEKWMESHRVEKIIYKEKTKRVVKSVGKSKTDIDRIIKNAIDESKGLRYNSVLVNQVESSTQKGGDHGLV